MSIEYVELTIEDTAPIEITISDIPEAGPGGGAGVTDGDKGDIVVSESGATWTIDWLTIYNRTADPGIEGQPWNDNGLLRFSTGYSPSLDFSIAANSMYLSLLSEEF